MSSSHITCLAASALLPNNTLIPLSHVAPGAEPFFVNCKQYHAILRRREKKRRLVSRNACLKKLKYQSRSLHAQRRARTGDGKFLGKMRASGGVTPADVADSPSELLCEEPCAEQWTDSSLGLVACRREEAAE